MPRRDDLVSDLETNRFPFDPANPENAARAAQAAPEAEEANKTPKSEVAYGSPPSDTPSHTCGRCSHFDGAFRCEVVRGDINSDMWCTQWEDANRDVNVSRRPDYRIETTVAGAVGTGPEKALGGSSKYDGTCRYCGSPTVNGKHSWGWSGCKNYVKPKKPEGLEYWR